jgi:hypothetical protein
MRLQLSSFGLFALLACQPAQSTTPTNANYSDGGAGDSTWGFPPSGRGDSISEADETTTDCREDCGGAVGCGDGVCEAPESTATCSADCGSWCGDNVCNGNEAPSLCPQDCSNNGEGNPPPADCSGCLNGAADCKTHCINEGHDDGFCGAPGSKNPHVCCVCTGDNDPPPGQGSVCGDGDCNGNENSTNCGVDCEPDCGPSPHSKIVNGKCLPSCGALIGNMKWGDGICCASGCADGNQPPNTTWDCNYCCPGKNSCSAASAKCGDGVCNGDESSTNCAQDCGANQPPGNNDPVLQWTFYGKIAGGEQSDAVRGPDNRAHLIADRYAQFDINATKVLDEAPSDGDQGAMSFPPAIAVGDNSTVHIVTRHDGDWGSGYQIRYRRRNAQGNWDQDYIFGSKVKRNYVVGVAWAGPNEVYMSHSHGGDDVWGDLHIFKAGGTGSAAKIGTIGGIWRADSDSRMRGVPGRVFLVSGKPNGGGKAAYTLRGSTGGNVAENLKNTMTTHIKGNGRTGFPDLAVDGTDTVHVTYGAHETVYYNKFAASGQQLFGNDKQIFSGLNAWHLSSGLSAVAASDDGNKVLAVALRSDGGQTASNSDLLWAYSTDGGNSWSTPQDTGHNAKGGEGRCRPRIVAIGNKFFVFYRDKEANGISLATFSL